MCHGASTIAATASARFRTQISSVTMGARLRVWLYRAGPGRIVRETLETVSCDMLLSIRQDCLGLTLILTLRQKISRYVDRSGSSLA